MPRQSIEQIKRKKPIKTIVNISAFKALIQAIALRPRTRDEIQELTGLCNSTVSRWLNILRRTNGKDNVIYVYDYVRRGDRGNWAERFLLGYGMHDAVRPKPLTTAQYCERYRMKRIQNAEACDA